MKKRLNIFFKMFEEIKKFHTFANQSIKRLDFEADIAQLA